MKKLYFFIALFSTGYFFGQVNYLVDNFDYTAGAFLTDNNWINHSATANNPTVNNGGLSWTGYIGSNVGNAALINNTGVDINRPMAATLSSGNVYASFLFKPSAAITSTSTGDYFFHLLKYNNVTTPVFSSINSAHRSRVFVIQGSNPATQFKLGLTFNAASYDTNVTGDLDINTTYLVVVKYTFIAGTTNDTTSLYVFAPGENIANEPVTPTLGPLTNTPSGTPPVAAPDAGDIQGVALRQNTAGQNCIVDGLYVRDTWDLTSAGVALTTNTFSQNKSLKIYPNPVNENWVTIKSAIEGDKEVTLFDLNGRIILKKTMSSDTLDLSSVNKGIYLIQTKIGTYVSNEKLVLN